jgi:hypothetical protein
VSSSGSPTSSSSGSPLAFLFQGSTPAQGTNYGQSQTNVPTWLQEYTQGVLAQANSLASQPYQTYGAPRIAPLTDQQTQAESEVGNLQGQYQPALTQAQQMATTASNPAAIQSALGTLPQAQQDIQGALAPTAASMNPYEQNVIQQAQDQATQYWQNTLQPSINNQFTAAGQFGSAANQRAQDITGQQLTQNIQDTSNAALASGFTNAQNVGLQGGSALGSLAQVGGGLGYEQGALGLQGANTTGSLASQGQALGLQGAEALDASGAEQQNMNQENLSLGYQDFLNQQQYPYQQASWLSQMIGGTASPTTVPGLTQGQQTSYAPYTSASPLSQSVGLYAGLNSGSIGSALSGSTGGAARGGSIRRKARRSGLDHLREAA